MRNFTINSLQNTDKNDQIDLRNLAISQYYLVVSKGGS